MRILKLALPLALVCLLAAACSSDSDSGGSMTATPAATTVIAEDLPQPTEAGDGLSAVQRAVADKIAASYATEVAVTDEQARCTAERSTAGFSDARLSELGISAAAIPDRGFTWGNYDLTTPEASTVVDATLECMDRMNLATAFLASHGYSLDEATCMADALANDEEALRTLITQTLVGDEESASTILSPLIEGCIDWRGFLAEMLVAEGISPESAECVAEGMSDEAFQVMLSGQEPEGDEGVIELFGELLELQNRCLTPEEIESMNGFGTP